VSGRGPSAAVAALLAVAFAAALLAPSRSDGLATRALAAGDVVAAGATAASEAKAAGSGVLVPGQTPGDVAPQAPAGTQPTLDDGPPTADSFSPSLAAAPRELLAYAVSCGDLRAIEPRQDSPVYRLQGIANACAPGWTPDGRLAVVEPLGRPPGSVSALRLIARDGSVENVAVPGRSVTGRAAIWEDGTVEVCAVERRSPYRLGLYRREPGRAEAAFIGEGCFPSVSSRGALAYATGTTRQSAAAPGTLRGLRIEPAAGVPAVALTLPEPSIDLRWTGDGSHVVAVTAGGGHGAVVAIDLKGTVRTLALAPQGALSTYPAPTGTGVAVVQTSSDASVRVVLMDVRSGNRLWSIDGQGVTRVAWQPTRRVALVSDTNSWRIVDGVSGEVRTTLPRLGGEPAWCCPPTVQRVRS
jgi:hypothetical protein